MPRYKVVDNVRIQLTAEEETARDVEEAAHTAKQAKEVKIAPKTYVAKRKAAYPPIGDQLDYLWHSIDESAELKQKYFSFYEAIKAVKAKYPK